MTEHTAALPPHEKANVASQLHALIASHPALRERDAIASDGLVDQARDLRTSECGRALHENPARLGGALQ